MCGGSDRRDAPLYLLRIPLPTHPVFLNGFTDTTMSPTYVYTTSYWRGATRRAAGETPAKGARARAVLAPRRAQSSRARAGGGARAGSAAP